MAHNLLLDPLLTTRSADGIRSRLTLPGALAGLSAGSLHEFARARPHQFDPWMMFLTQLAVHALHKSGSRRLPTEEAEWRDLILALGGGNHEPWCLVVDDASKPAFFQPPIPGAGPGWTPASAQWATIRFPDERDILVTAKGHDLKARRMPPDDLEAWVFALCTLQTMQGYPSPGYYGISRMKGGFGNRPRVGLAPGLDLRERFTRDVAVLQSTWADLTSKRGYRDSGLGLVWLDPWDGGSSLGLADLAPHFIEVCQRIRCTSFANGLILSYTTSEARRCLPTIENGDVGDAWIPIEREEGALTVGPSGFSYRLLCRIILGNDFEEAPAQSGRTDDGELMLFIASALARGQGKTQGIHDRVLPLPARVRRRLGQPDQRAALGRRARLFVQRADDLRSKVLFSALKALVPDDASPSDTFDTRVDDCFFSELFDSLELADDAAQLVWEKRLATIGRRELESAIERCALGETRHYAAIAKATSLFESGLRRRFPDLFPSTPAMSADQPEVTR